MTQPKARWIYLAAAALPMLIPPMLIWLYGINFPYLDQWDKNLGGLFVRMHQGTLKLGDFFTQHNEHRIHVPRLVLFVLGVLTHWNHYVEMIATWLVACASSVGILILILRSMKLSIRKIDGRTAFLWFLCNFALFTPLEFENWQWGVGLINVMPLLWLVLALLVAGSNWRAWTKTAATVLLCILSTLRADPAT